MTEVTFAANNMSSAIAMSGVVKIKVDDMQSGGFVQIWEERVDGAYEKAKDKEGNNLQVKEDQVSVLFELLGNYKLERSSDHIRVGYES